MVRKMAKEPRHSRMYKTKPHMERGDDGKMAVTKNEKEADKVQSGDDGVKMTEGMPMNIRHAHERMDMHKRHEIEHAVHDHSKVGSKAEMHGRHQAEMKNMHARHEKEIGSGENKDQDIKKGHETGKDESASEAKSAKKE